MPDALGRQDVSPSIKASIENAFVGVDGRGALLVIADETGTRAHLAAKLGDHWKVAGGGGVNWADTKPTGFVAVQATW